MQVNLSGFLEDAKAQFQGVLTEKVGEGARILLLTASGEFTGLVFLTKAIQVQSVYTQGDKLGYVVQATPVGGHDAPVSGEVVEMKEAAAGFRLMCANGGWEVRTADHLNEYNRKLLGIKSS